MKVKRLKGFEGLRALWAYSSLVLGIKMLPAYGYEQYEEFLQRVQSMPVSDQAKVFKEAAVFVPTEKIDVLAMAQFCLDPNGVPYSKENFDSLELPTILEIIVSVCLEIASYKLDFTTEAEKKN